MADPQRLIPIKTPERFEAVGIPWNTKNQAYWAFRNRDDNGLAGAFVRIGRDIFVDPVRFHELVRKRQTTATAGAPRRPRKSTSLQTGAA
jgi:hypothetical protein